MTDPLVPTATEATDIATETQTVVDKLASRIAAIERERKQIRREDWNTLFRQIRTVASELIAHPFVKGDLEAEMRIARMLAAGDLEDFALRVAHLEEYVLGKLAFNRAVAALENGEAAPDRPAPMPVAPVASENLRRVTAHGPSGSDFALTPGDAPSSSPRRGILRL